MIGIHSPDPNLNFVAEESLKSYSAGLLDLEKQTVYLWRQLGLYNTLITTPSCLEELFHSFKKSWIDVGDGIR